MTGILGRNQANEHCLYMKTRIVYVVASSDKDTYLEQAWVSAYSVKLHTPGAPVVFVTDMDTYERILSSNCKNALQVVDEILPVAVDGNLSNTQRSRWIKTNLRNLIARDFLFIDTDTVVTGDLSEVDSWDICMGAVWDMHCAFGLSPSAGIVRERMRKIFNCVPHPGTQHFNSGVLYVKDCGQARHFFDIWHKNWLYSYGKGFYRDQIPLMKTCDELPGVVSPIPGDYNCQILYSFQFLHTARVVHYFKSMQNGFCPFPDKEICQSVKHRHEITGEVADWLLHGKEHFISSAVPVWRSHAFALLKWLYGHGRLMYKSIDFAAHVFQYIIRQLNARHP